MKFKGEMLLLVNFKFYGIYFCVLMIVNGGEVIKQSELDAYTGVRATPASIYFNLDNPHPRYYLRVYPNNEIIFVWEKELLESASLSLRFLTKIKDELKFNVRLVNPFNVPTGGTHMFDKCGIQLEYAMKENCKITKPLKSTDEWECTCRDSLPRLQPPGFDTESLKIRHQDKDRLRIEGMQTAEYSTVAVLHLEYRYSPGFPKYCSYQIILNRKYHPDNGNSEFGNYILLESMKRIPDGNRVKIEHINTQPQLQRPPQLQLQDQAQRQFRFRQLQPQWLPQYQKVRRQLPETHPPQNYNNNHCNQNYDYNHAEIDHQKEEATMDIST